MSVLARARQRAQITNTANGATTAIPGNYWWDRAPTYSTDYLYSTPYYSPFHYASQNYTPSFRIASDDYSWDGIGRMSDGQLILNAEQGKIYYVKQNPDGTTEMVEVCSAPYEGEHFVERGTVIEDPPGRVPGKYLELTLSSGETIVTSLEDLIDTYAQSFDPYKIIESYSHKHTPKSEEELELKNTKPIRELFG